MSEPLPEIACENCLALCCKAPTYMQLTQAEYELHSPPMDLVLIAKPRNYPQRVQETPPNTGFMDLQTGVGLFELQSGCANLNEADRCSIYATRPQCCRDFKVGSPACRKARRAAGLDTDRPIHASELPEPELNATEQLVADFFPTHSDAPAAGVVASIATTVPPLDLAVVRTTVAREVQWINERLAQCEAGSWSRRTRCAGWDVAALVAHLVTGQQFAHEILTAALEGRAAEIPPEYSGGRVATIEAFGRAAREVIDTLAFLPPDAVTREVLLGADESVTVEHLLQVMVMELAVHGLDLAAALGESRHLSSDAVQAIAHLLPDYLDPGVTPRRETAYVLRSPAFELFFTWRNNAWRRAPADDACYIDGEPEAVLLYALGRVPFNKSGLVTNRPDVAGAFKSHLVGP